MTRRSRTDRARGPVCARPARADRASGLGLRLERVTGIEPAFSAWEADVLPLNYTRSMTHPIVRDDVASGCGAPHGELAW